MHGRILAMAKKGSDLLGEAAHDRLTFIDIGANTGCFTLMALDPPALRVLALEAKKKSQKVLSIVTRYTKCPWAPTWEDMLIGRYVYRMPDAWYLRHEREKRERRE